MKRMPFPFRCLPMVASVALFHAANVSADHTVTITANEAPLIDAPVTAPLPATLASGAVQLRDGQGKAVPAQADTLDGKPAVTFIVPRLSAGASVKYSLEPAKAEETGEAQGVVLKEQTGETLAEGLDIRIDGEYFTTYLTDAGPKPYCWPIIGPTGKPITRAYPMRTGAPGERDDHRHHRSFWFSHDKVNGSDFWSESPRAGKTVHRDFERITSGPVFGEFVANVDWIAKDGKKVCEDTRRMRVYRVPNARLLDFGIAVKATEGPILFGDSKEGLFGFRVAGSMKVDQGKGKPKGGTLLNANGDRDKAAWGKRAAWCDYYGPLNGAVVGIAIFDNPDNFRFPTYWHARTYGLFTANPFGLSYFTGDKSKDGSHRIAAGKQFRQQYRVYMHKGDTAQADVADRFAVYADPPNVTVSE